MASHDLNFDVSHNGVMQPPSHDQQMGGTMDMGAGNGGGDSYMSRLNSESSHPMACIFHCVFKFLSIFLYVFGGWFTGDGKGGTSGAGFVTLAVISILLLAADFWVVKNITGRLLVGLRWWNKVEGDNTIWIYESAETAPNGSAIARNKFDGNVFWSILYLTPLIWGIMLFIGLLKFELGWLVIVLMALGLSLANVYGYYKCSKDQAAKFQAMMSSGVQTGALSGAFGIMKSSVLGALTGTPTNSQPNSPQNYTIN